MLTFSRACSASVLSKDIAEPDLPLFASGISFDIAAGINPGVAVSCILMFSLTLTNLSVDSSVDKRVNL